MLVVALEGRFLKKLVGDRIFTCEDGALLREAVLRAARGGEGELVKPYAIGRDSEGNVVSEWAIQWSLKARAKGRV